MFYAGDGVSDLSAARESDLLFAKKGHGAYPLLLHANKLLTSNADLIKYCVKEDIPFTVFDNFKTIMAKVQEIV